ncbi:MAG: hypothetical protein II747_00005, partial [Clostridia bacterium]|nr:hypothetical protein [Clostridia bacterium]
NIARKKNAYDRAQADYEQTLQTVEAEVRRAIADRDGSADALHSRICDILRLIRGEWNEWLQAKNILII